MLELRELTCSTFAQHLGEPFRMIVSDQLTLELRLTEAIELGDPPAPELRAPYSLVFSAPAEPIVAQRTYRLENDRLGTLELFLVPLQPDSDGARYQAVFN